MDNLSNGAGQGSIRVYRIMSSFAEFFDTIRSVSYDQIYCGGNEYFNWGNLSDNPKKDADGRLSHMFRLFNKNFYGTNSFIHVKQVNDNFLNVKVFFEDGKSPRPWWDVLEKFALVDLNSVEEIQSPPQSGHQHYSEFERFKICLHFILDKRNGSVTSMLQWCNDNYPIDERTLRNYLNEFALKP